MSRRSLPKVRRADRLTAPDLHEEPGACACAAALAALDGVRAEMDRAWGTDRLPELLPHDPPPHVPADRREAYRSILPRYGDAVEALHAALDRNDVAAVQEAVARVVKALRIMDAQCRAAGVQRPEPDTLETELDGARVIIVADTRDAAEVERRNPGARVVTAREAAVAVERMKQGLAALGEIRRQWPGVELEPTAKAAREELEDEIPF